MILRSYLVTCKFLGYDKHWTASHSSLATNSHKTFYSFSNSVAQYSHSEKYSTDLVTLCVSTTAAKTVWFERTVTLHNESSHMYEALPCPLDAVTLCSANGGMNGQDSGTWHENMTSYVYAFWLCSCTIVFFRFSIAFWTPLFFKKIVSPSPLNTLILWWHTCLTNPELIKLILMQWKPKMLIRYL